MLNIANKNLYTIPDNIPCNITVLECAENNLTELPKLPESLEILDCPENKIQIIDMLNNINLKILNCSSNNIYLLNIIYDKIIELYYAYNNITNYDIIGKYMYILERQNIILQNHIILEPLSTIFCKINVLNCQSNKLLYLPDISQTKIYRLNCSYNYIKKIGKLPKSIKYLHCEYNQLTNKSIKYLEKNKKYLEYLQY